MVSKIMMDRTDLMEHKTASNYVPLKWKQNMYSQHELRQKDGALQVARSNHHTPSQQQQITTCEHPLLTNTFLLSRKSK